MHDPVRFVPALPEQLARISEIVREAFTPYIARMGREPAPMTADLGAAIDRGEVLLAERDGRIVGVLVSEEHEDHVLVDTIAVAAEARGGGIGALLLDRAEARARRLGVAELRLYTNAKMTENLEYYPRRGFEEVDRRVEDGYDRVFYVRPVGGR